MKLFHILGAGMNKLIIKKKVLPFLVGGVVLYMSMFSTIPESLFYDTTDNPVTKNLLEESKEKKKKI